jgi:hypothetical protein
VPMRLLKAWYLKGLWHLVSAVPPQHLASSWVRSYSVKTDCYPVEHDVIQDHSKWSRGASDQALEGSSPRGLVVTITPLVLSMH